jgi:Domain of unknown function (DUF1996)
MRRSPVLAMAVLAMVLVGLLATPSPSRADDGTWVLQCSYTRSLPDDPIVHPRMPGMAHLHDFFGNTSVDAFSTYRSMRAAGTTCPQGDTAGYWLPAVLRDGTKVDPAGRGVREQVYVSADNLAPGTHIEPFPPDLRMVAGNAHATRASENPDLGEEIYWGCSDNSVGGKPLAPPACPSGVVSLHVGFPNCWDGMLTHVDDTAHLRHPVGYRCPAGFPHALPRLILRTEYPVGAGGRITLSSGPTFTAHGDFWNTWDQAKLASLVDRCLNAGRDCGVFRGSGTSAGAPVPTPSSAKPPATAPARPAPSTTRARAPEPSSAAREAGGHQHHPAAVAAQATTASTPPREAAGQAGGSALPFTGGPAGALAALAIGLLGLGGGLLVRGWKPRQAPRH